MVTDLKQIVVALRECRRFRAVKTGKSIHSRLIKTGFSHDVYLVNNLLALYIDNTPITNARKLFDEIPQRNIVTWTTMLSAYSNNGNPLEAIKLYTRFLDSKPEITPNGFTYSVVLKACGLVNDIELGKLVHERIRLEGLDNDVILMNTLIDMYVKCGSLIDARRVFDGMITSAISSTWNTIIYGYCKEGLMDEAVKLFEDMPEQNVVSWNTMVAGFVENRSLLGLELMSRMHKRGFKLDEFTLPCTIKTCSWFGLLDVGKVIHCYALKLGFKYSYFIASALVDMYSNCNALSEARKIFDQFKVSKDLIRGQLVLWNSMLSGFVANEQNEAAIDLFLLIHQSGAGNDSYTLSNALRVCTNLLSLRLGSQVHALVVVGGYGFDNFVGSILVDLYSKLGNIKNALRLFHSLPEKDTVAWSTIIIGCAKMGLDAMALVLFRDMVNLNLEVDEFVASSILKVCSNLASLRSGKQVHSFCVKSGYESEGVTSTALIDMYSKCGEVEDALALFDSVSNRDVVCWTGIILGCAQNGRAKEAIALFHEMIKFELMPNEVTYLGVLTACRHAGLIMEASTIFGMMKYVHGLQPHLEHYYCVIDLLGQAGRFNEAEKLIDEMPFKPDKTIWNSLLSACGVHGNPELATVIAKNLLSSFPDDLSVYVMLSNVYATLEMWDGLSQVRNAAKSLGAKEAGMSWADVAC